jgi:cytochrome c-type biogenesis protein CcmH/NrfF
VRRLAALAAVALLGLALAPAALAAGCPRASLGDVEDEVMCPVCGTPLNLATEAPQANRERTFIQSLIDRCRSKDQIKQALKAQYGDRVLATPDDHGFDLAAYIVPALAVLAGAGGIALAAARWRRRRGPQEAAPAAPARAAQARLDSDLERYDL